MPSQSFRLRDASCHALRYGTFSRDFSCKGERFATLSSVIVASLPGLVLASREATYEHSSLVFDSPEPGLVVILNSSQHRYLLNKRIRLLEV